MPFRFNLSSVIIFLPLEIMFGFLPNTGMYPSEFVLGGDSMSVKGFNFIKPCFQTSKTAWDFEYLLRAWHLLTCVSAARI